MHPAGPRPPVPPVAGDDRPTWSVMVPTHDNGDDLAETLGSVLVQAPEPSRMQIEVVDDASAQDPAPLVAEVGGGRVALHRIPVNGGHVATFNTCLRRARGHLVHVLHGDDAVRPGFYEALGAPLLDHPEVGAAFCRYIGMDERSNWTSLSALEADAPGVIEDWLERIASGQRLQPPSMVVRRSVYEAVGGFDTRIASYGEDWEMWVRIAAHAPVWFEPRPLALYRVRGSSLSGASLRTGDDVRQLRQVIELNREVLPPGLADRASAAASRAAALAAVRRATRLVHRGEWRAASNQVRQALITDRSPVVIARLAVLLVRAARQLARPARGKHRAG